MALYTKERFVNDITGKEIEVSSSMDVGTAWLVSEGGTVKSLPKNHWSKVSGRLKE